MRIGSSSEHIFINPLEPEAMRLCAYRTNDESYILIITTLLQLTMPQNSWPELPCRISFAPWLLQAYSLNM